MTRQHGKQGADGVGGHGRALGLCGSSSELDAKVTVAYAIGAVILLSWAGVGGTTLFHSLLKSFKFLAADNGEKTIGLRNALPIPGGGW